MIVCSCNVLSDTEIRSAASAAEIRPRTTGQMYGCLGCSAQCGRCARTIRRLMDEALEGAECVLASNCGGCPHHAAPAGEPISVSIPVSTEG